MYADNSSLLIDPRSSAVSFIPWTTFNRPMADPQNIEMSFSRLEHDRLRFLTFNSPALGGNRGDVTIFVPPLELQSRNLPLVALLHGVYGSHWSWAFNG